MFSSLRNHKLNAVGLIEDILTVYKKSIRNRTKYIKKNCVSRFHRSQKKNDYKANKRLNKTEI